MDINLCEEQKELFDIIIRFKSGNIKLMSEFKPLKRFVFYRLKRIKRTVKEDVYSEFLLSVWNGAYIPEELKTYSYIKSRLINALIKCGIIKDRRYKNSRLSGMVMDESYLENAVYVEKAFQEFEVMNLIRWEERRNLFE